jgi:HAD superfamily hydrolase (TIGR01509 family)
MNILIPLCGKGERFLSKGFNTPKPLIRVFGKEIISYVIDSLKLSTFNNVYIITNDRLITSKLDTMLKEIYPGINIINLKRETRGAAETIFRSVEFLKNNNPCLIIDGDNFYTAPIISEINKLPNTNQVVCFETNFENPIFSYIEFDENKTIINIAEKQKISNFANTGAYYFTSVDFLKEATLKALNTIIDKEPYISHAIQQTLSTHDWKPIIINSKQYFSLGTPEQVENYKKNSFGFLFDLDGTLVDTDDAYYEVWKSILSEYNIFLNKEIYQTYIWSNNDTNVKEHLLSNVSCSIDEISFKKDKLFLNHIDSIKIINNAVEFINDRQNEGHKVAIVTNSNRIIALEILKKIGITPDKLIIGSECNSPKPAPDPYLNAIKELDIDKSKCFIFEDSKNGITSAKGANVKCIIGISHKNPNIICSNPDIVFNDFTFPIESIVTFNKQPINYKDIITFSLKNKYNIEDINVNSIQLKGGFIADVLSTNMTLDGQKVNAIIKLINNNDSQLNKMAHFLELYDREIYFYETIAPFVPINVPKCYGILRDLEFKQIGFILEDLRDNAILNKNLNTESIELSLSVISSMATLHASFWNKNIQTKFKNLKKHNDTIFQPAWGNFLESRIHLFTNKWKTILSEKHISLISNIVQNFNKIQDSLSTAPLTLCHGDIKSPNIFYKENTPYFIDWQYISNGKGVQDLVFFMIESFSKDRIQILYPLFKNYYYTKLLEFGVTDYSFEQYNDDIINAMCHFPFFVALWFGTTPNSDLIDLNFPYFFIQRLFSFYDIVLENKHITF